MVDEEIYKKSSTVHTRGGNARPHDQLEREEASAQLKLERKKHRKDLDLVNEELVPKATGREALLEKKKQASEFHKQEKVVDMEFSDDFLMGSGSDDYRRALQRSKVSQQKRQDHKEKSNAALAERRSQARAKEEALLSQFRQVAEKGDFPLLRPRPP